MSKIIVKGLSHYVKNAYINENGKYPEKYGVGIELPEIVESETPEVEKAFKSKIKDDIFKCFNSKYPIKKTWRKKEYFNENLPNKIEIEVALEYHPATKGKDDYFTVNGIRTFADFKSNQEDTFSI